MSYKNELFILFTPHLHLYPQKLMCSLQFKLISFVIVIKEFICRSNSTSPQSCFYGPLCDYKWIYAGLYERNQSCISVIDIIWLL